MASAERQITAILTPEQWKWFVGERDRLKINNAQLIRALVTDAMLEAAPLPPAR